MSSAARSGPMRFACVPASLPPDLKISRDMMAKPTVTSAADVLGCRDQLETDACNGCDRRAGTAGARSGRLGGRRRAYRALRAMRDAPTGITLGLAIVQPTLVLWSH